jgi:hypothetical protein
MKKHYNRDFPGKEGFYGQERAFLAVERLLSGHKCATVCFSKGRSNEKILYALHAGLYGDVADPDFR